MATQAYRLTLLLRTASSDMGTTPQTVTIATETAGDAVELAQLYQSDPLDGFQCSATLTDAAGAVLRSEQDASPVSTPMPAEGRGCTSVA